MAGVPDYASRIWDSNPTGTHYRVGNNNLGSYAARFYFLAPAGMITDSLTISFNDGKYVGGAWYGWSNYSVPLRVHVFNGIDVSVGYADFVPHTLEQGAGVVVGISPVTVPGATYYVAIYNPATLTDDGSSALVDTPLVIAANTGTASSIGCGMYIKNQGAWEGVAFLNVVD
jgi:hypothetical protein